MAKELPKPAPSFHVYARAGNYNGTHPSKVRFEAGFGTTGDARAAQHCRDAGLDVFDVNDEGDAKRLKAFLAERNGPSK